MRLLHGDNWGGTVLGFEGLALERRGTSTFNCAQGRTSEIDVTFSCCGLGAKHANGRAN